MSGLIVAAKVLVQEHSANGFNVATYKDRMQAALQLARSEVVWSKTPHADIAQFRAGLAEIAQDYGLEGTDEDRLKASLDMAALMSGHDDRSSDCFQALGEILYDAGYRKQVAP